MRSNGAKIALQIPQKIRITIAPSVENHFFLNILGRQKYTVFIQPYTHKMDFTGTSFRTKWLKDSNILRVRIIQLEENTFHLLDVILDAAVKQGNFSVAWDLSKMQTLSTFQCFKIVSPSLRIKDKIANSVIRSSVVVPERYAPIINKLLRYVAPTTPTHVGSSSQQAKEFIGL